MSDQGDNETYGENDDDVLQPAQEQGKQNGSLPSPLEKLKDVPKKSKCNGFQSPEQSSKDQDRSSQQSQTLPEQGKSECNSFQSPKQGSEDQNNASHPSHTQPVQKKKCNGFQSPDQSSEDQDNLTHKIHDPPQQVNEVNHIEKVNHEVIKEVTENHSPSLFCEVEQRVLRLRKMNDTLSCKALHKVLIWGTQEKSSTMNYYDYLIQVKKIPNSNLKYAINRDQKEKMSKDPTGSIFDVTLLFTLIKLACANVADFKSPLWCTDGDTLEQTLKYLKGFRNDIFHDRSQVTLTEFMQKTEDFRDNLEKCLRFAGERYSIDESEIERLVAEMNDDIGRIRDIPVAVFDITNYDNKPLFQERCNLLTTLGKVEMLEGYDKFCNFNPVAFIAGRELSIDIGTIFTRIEVVTDKKHDSNTDSQPIEYEQLLTYESKTEGGSYKIKLIEGPAGSGKSTLTRKIMGDWSSKDSAVESLSSFDLLLYMECRDTSNTSFLQLLSALMPKTARRFRNDDMEKCALSLNLLIIVDGLDEMNKSSIQLFKEILNLRKNHRIYLLCTTRPEKIEDCYKLMASGEQTTCLKITGIPASRRDEFASKYHDELRKLGQSQQETRGLVAYLRTNQQHLQEHLRLPLNLVLLTYLWSIAPEKVNCVTTATELYFELHKLTVEKLLLRLKSKEDLQNLSVHDLQSKVESVIIKLCYHALIGLKNDEIMLSDESESVLKDTCSNVGLPHEESLGAFLVHKVLWRSTGLTYKVNYPHKGIQEFLSALFILLKLKDKGIDLDVRCFIRSNLKTVSPEFGSETTNDSYGNVHLNNVRNFFRRLYKRFRDAYSGMQSDNDPTSSTGRTPVTLRAKRHIESYCNHFMEGPCSSAIIKILKEMYPDESVRHHKFKETFVHLTGLLHLTSKNNISKNLIVELVTILQKTGIKKREEWLDLISNVKCDDIVADVIAEKVPAITTENITIKDSRVYSYLSLFQKKCPDTLNIDITATPGNVPRLEELLSLLSQHMCEVTRLEFHDEFQYPSHITSSIDWAVQQIFQDCQVSFYRGAISQRFPTKIPSSIIKFRTGIANPEQYSELKRLLNATSVLSSMKRLVIHLVNGIDPSKLSPLPEGLNVHLYLSEVGPKSVEWAVKAAKAVMAGRRGFVNILFPRCSLDEGDFLELVTSIAEAKIKVSAAICTSANIPFSSVQDVQNHARLQLTADFRIIPEYEIWTKW